MFGAAGINEAGFIDLRSKSQIKIDRQIPRRCNPHDGIGWIVIGNNKCGIVVGDDRCGKSLRVNRPHVLDEGLRQRLDLLSLFGIHRSGLSSVYVSEY